MPLCASPEIVPALLSMPAGSEWLIILVIALLLFGKRLPEILRGLGSSVREFKKGMDGHDDPPAPLPPALSRDPVRPVDGAVSRESLPQPEDASHQAPQPPRA